MNILGISAFYHDSAAALIVDGQIVAAVQEERFSRIKHDKSYPKEAIKSCLELGNLSIDDIDYICFYEKPMMKFNRLMQTHITFAPYGYLAFKEVMSEWLTGKIFLKRLLISEFKKISNRSNWKEKLLFSEHHMSHAASAYYPSPFKRAAILTLDGVGEWATSSFGVGYGNKIEIKKEIHFPHSLGLLYSAFTYYNGFKVNSGEYKLMGLAAYGKPIYVDLIKDNLIDIKNDGSFRLDMSYFQYCEGFQMTSEKFHNLFKSPPRKSETAITQRDMDLAASIQMVTEEVVTKLARSIAEQTGEKNLVLAGGVALNCVCNGRLLKEKIFDKIWIQPASGDAGGSLGAALAAFYAISNEPRLINHKDSMSGGYLGPEYKQNEIETSLKSLGANYKLFSNEKIIEITCKALIDGMAVGWHQGRMEFGPRALGSRSIIADARSVDMQKTLNLKVKFRESFRPFAPSVLNEKAEDWFDMEAESPYMAIVSKVKKEHREKISDLDNELQGIKKLNIKRSSLPAITHVDYSARIQTVHEETNPKYYALIKRFEDLTGCPVIINTSFNIRGEPIVNSPSDAYKCFMGTELDLLVIGNCILKKEDQDHNSFKDYKSQFLLD
ncbi:carbamoyltransferase [Gammaproteobacteria bacterium]|nr:carbamoyltransferase [Gammaproteobacteria bacterium]